MIDISGQLDTVKHVVYINEEGISAEVSLAQNCTSWKVESFEEVIRLGSESPVEANMPLPSDVAVIMYTSGSTGLPKVCFIYTSWFLFFVNLYAAIFPLLTRIQVGSCFLYTQIKSEVEFSNYISAVELTCISFVYREL